ncbi:triose-phosphate isomerase [Lactobacillus sp. S2-2]|uniref:triose-phosphate isomerase n=1 Tax=Lactobacillus sp. S2-2 TaxID=2692917 RepID=UPI001F00F5D5|nr:triose-phosphate isomerase [Lactobacillus sp. S2-2]MCF6515701.1 triose-phosphate isomerase [Lactobacillus sp. S2-2]
MRIPFIAGNWKMNLSLEDALDFIDSIKKDLPDSNVTETAIAASPLFLQSIIDHKKDSQLKIIAENCFYKDDGAYTGEVSPKVLSEIGTDYVIIGHSERRKYFNETNDIINKKVHAVLRNNMNPIICCDETMGRLQSENKIHWVVNQVNASLKGVSAEDAKNIIIAYEPSWAIGTGTSASNDDAQEGCYLIRQTLADIYSDEIADEIRILYGGSVNYKNVTSLMEQRDIDGVLAGKSSIDSNDFIKLVNYKKNQNK